MEANTLAEAPIIVAGTDEQKKKWLTPLTEEFLLTAYCVTEPDAGSDVQGIKTKAKRHGNDYVLSGSKMWITNGGVAEWYFVVAYTDPEKRHRGMSANTLAEAPIIVAGTDEQKKKWLTPLTEEFLLTAYCVTEPDAGSDVQGIKTKAKRHGNDYVLSGSKMWITNGGVAEWYFVVAYTDPEKRHRGMSAFIVPRDSEGVSVGKKENNLGQRASDTRAVNFQDVKVPAANRIGEEGDGWRAAMAAFDHSRPVVASAAVGLAQSAYDHAVAYAKERKTFGVPIYKHQSIGFMIADMAVAIQAARLLVWESAWTIDQGKRNTKQAAFAKLFAADTAVKVATDAVQVFGGNGFNKEYPVEKLYRDAKIYQIYEGTSQIQRLIVQKEIFDR